MKFAAHILTVGTVIGLGAMTSAQPAVAQTVAATVEADSAIQVIALSPEARALRDALEAAAPQTDPIRDFYQARSFAPVWTDARLAALEAALATVAEHGLPAARYDLDAIAALRGDLASDGALREITASLEFLKYAREISSGLIEPRSADRDIVVSPRRPEPAALLAGLDTAQDPVTFFADLAPGHHHYRTLLDEKRRLEDVIASGGWGQPVPEGKSLKPGQSAARVPALRARLGLIDGRDYGDSPAYDDELVEVVKAFQLRHGLNDDGVAGPKTIAAVNAGPEQRLKQVLVNLERQRWLNYDRGDRHIYVNQADFSVSVIDDGQITYWSRTVIGKNRHKTQEFNDTMTHMVVNPTWHVPRSIATEEMLPRLKRNPTALGSSMQVMTRSGTRINPALVDFTQFTQSNFPFIIKQRPGGGNALGRVKFMFPNKFNIYLHDTPAKSLFNKDVRAYSHGCVRVQKPFELAHTLLSAQSDDPEGLFSRLLGSGRERQVNLEQPVPIYLTYQTAWIDDAGLPQYRSDIYGRDARVFDALEAEGVTLGLVEG